MNVKKICILGGGSSGFITSSLLAKYRELSGLDFDIKVIHSKSIGNVGVGESTIFNILEFFSYLGLKESEWMNKCDATYKTSIRFENFYKNGRYFHYPFGPVNANATEFDWSIYSHFFPEIFSPEKAHIYFNPESILSERNKLNDYKVDKCSAYHFDTHLLGKYLLQYSKDHGVEIVDDIFVSATKHSDGSVASLVCENGEHTADLFIDCSGFRSLLLGGVMNEEYISFSDTLINNKAIVAKIPYENKEEQLQNYTNCVALKNGWCWEIPLWNHLSVGYVHTNKFASEQEIEKELFDRYGEVEYKTVEYKTGRYKRGWVKNVVAVGLSYGFIEPLESTGIATTLENAFRLLEFLSKRSLKTTQVDRDLFNYYTDNVIDQYRCFVETHYYLSSRDDTNYWKYVTDDIDYLHDTTHRSYRSNFLKRMIDDRMLDEITKDANGEDVFSGDLFVCAGMQYSCFSNAFTEINVDIKNVERSAKNFQEYVNKLEMSANDAPSTYKYLKNKIYDEY